MSKSTLQIVEIGPGLGDLTQYLLRKQRVVAFEVDTDLCVLLKKKFSNAIDEKRFILHQGDILEQWKPKEPLCEEPYRLVANLPYNIATQILLQALYDPYCKQIEVMVQKEVAQKCVAMPKTKSFCRLTVLTQSIANANILFDVPPEAFDPAPKVTSSVLRLEKRCEFVHGDSSLLANKEELLAFEAYLNIAFSAPRKQWIKNLSNSYDRANLEKILEKAKLSLQIRAHEIDPATHHHLFIQITKVNDYVRRNKEQ